MMEPKEYLLQRIISLKEKSATVSEVQNVTDYIFHCLMSKKFRKYSVTSEYQEHIHSAVESCVSRNEPIKISFVFGGYKLWRIEEAPEADWAELFSLIYFTNWLKPITEIYPPGVWFDFFSDDVILSTMNNVPKVDTERYIESFRKLLEFIKLYVPENLSFTLNRVIDQYGTYEEFQKDLENSIEQVRSNLGGKMPVLTPEQMAAIDLNVKIIPDYDGDSHWREKVQLIHDGYSRVSKRRPYYRATDKIMVVNKSIKDSLAIGTTKNSIVKFWIGAGVLERIPDGFVDHIFSPKRLKTMQLIKQDISIPKLEGKNFQSIKILR